MSNTSVEILSQRGIPSRRELQTQAGRIIGSHLLRFWKHKVALRNQRQHRQLDSNPLGIGSPVGGGLKLLPFWDPLRGDPRFEKIVASFAPKADK